MRKRDLNWLKTIRLCSEPSRSMYPGLQCEMLPKAPASRLRDAGYIELFIPHNPIHKERWTITTSGRAALKDTKP